MNNFLRIFPLRELVDFLTYLGAISGYNKLRPARDPGYVITLKVKYENFFFLFFKFQFFYLIACCSKSV
jgi:hypothetical protein